MNSALTSNDCNSDRSDPVSASDSSERPLREEVESAVPPKKISSVGASRRSPAPIISSQEQKPDLSSSSDTQATAASSISTPAVASAVGQLDDNKKKKAVVGSGLGARRPPAPAPKPAPGAAAINNNSSEATDAAVMERAAREAAKINAYGDGSRAGAVAVDERVTADETLEVDERMAVDQRSVKSDIEEGIVAEEIEVEIEPPAAAMGRAAREAAKINVYGDGSRAGAVAVDERVTVDAEAEADFAESPEPSPLQVPEPEITPDEENQESAPEPPSPIVPDPEGGGEESPSPPVAPIAPSSSQPPTATTTSAPPELPEAIPVPEPTALRSTTSMGSLGTAGGGEVVQAQPLEEWDEDKEGRKTVCGSWLSPTQWAVGALLIVVLIVVGVVVGITQSTGGGDGEEETEVTTPAPSIEEDIRPTADPTSCTPFEPFSGTLHFLTLQALKEPCSPQSRANTWMMQDPNLHLFDEQRKLQRFALATLYYSTSGDNWEHNDLWLDYERDECQWYNQDADGTTSVCDENSSIIHLNLARNSLNGVLPVELFFFPALATLDLSHNGLYGTAPTMFNGARFLERLVLSSNQLTGQFTAELGFVASKLASLHNDDNQFTGAVPGLLRLLPKLSQLNITGNQYTGALPASLIQLSDTLTSLEVSDNAITGVIPRELGFATNLQVIDVGGNAQLRGTIPRALASLGSLTLMDISDTAISGALPEELCELQQEGELEVLADCDGSFECCSA